ncbi:MAG: nucleotidyltransferase family protein [Bacteroidales bacterium]
MYIQEAIILAGGLGTRLKDVVSDIPKVMAPVNGRPFLEYVLDFLEDNIIEHVVLSVGYKHEIIQNHFKKRYKSISIDYAIEKEPLGTGGGIKKAFELINGSKALVFNGDTMFRVNLNKIFEFHFSKSAQFTVVLRQVDDVSRYGAVATDDNQRIVRFNEKGQREGIGKINGGIYLINRNFLTKNNFPEKFSLEKDCFEALVDTQAFYGVLCKQYFIDIGIPEDYQKAQDDFKEFEY